MSYALPKGVIEIFSFLFWPYAEVDIDSHLDVHSAQFDTVSNVNIRLSDTTKNPGQKVARATNETTNANGLVKPTIEMIPRDKYDIQRPFANYDGLFIPVAAIYNFNWSSKQLHANGVLEMAAWIRAPVAKRKPQPYR